MNSLHPHPASWTIRIPFSNRVVTIAIFLLVASIGIFADPCLARVALNVTSRASLNFDEKKDDTETTTKDPHRIGHWIAQLASPKFAERQQATEQLWLIGKPALEQLEIAEKTAEPDVARRIGGLTQLLKLGLDSNTSPEMARVIMRFAESENQTTQQRGLILRTLFQSQQYELSFSLLERVEDLSLIHI